LAPGEAAAMRRVQTPIRGCDELPINHLNSLLDGRRALRG
jgi:hypothetical protein